MKKRRGILLIALASVLAGAGYLAWRTLDRLQPEPPPRGASTKAAPALDSESSIIVPIAVDVGLIERLAEDNVPRDLLSQSGIAAAGGSVTVDLVVRRSGRITAEAREGKLHLRVPVEADIAAKWPQGGLLGLAARGRRDGIRTRAAFTIRAELDLGVDEAWNLATSTEATLRWEEDPVVQLGPVSVPLSTLVGDRIDAQFDAVVRTIDAQLRDRVPMRPLIEQAWAAAFRSLAIGPRGDLWIALRPTGLFLGEVQTRSGQVFLDAGIRGVFRVVFGEAPEAAAPTPLPARSAPPGEPGIALDVPVTIPFAAANDQLDQRVEGQTLDIPLDIVERSVLLTIETVEVYPSGEHLAVALDFSADLPGRWFDVRGQVYLVGMPTLDTRRSQLSVTDLTYDARTNAVLVDAAEWMLHDELVRRVQALMVFDFSARLDEYRDRANEALADYPLSPTARLRGHLEDAKIVSLTLTDAEIVAVARLRGAAEITLAPVP